MPGKIGASCPILAIRFSRSSSFTRRARNFSSEKGLRRNSPRVRGKLIGEQLQKQLSAGSKNKVRRECSDYTPQHQASGFRRVAAESLRPNFPDDGCPTSRRFCEKWELLKSKLCSLIFLTADG